MKSSKLFIFAVAVALTVSNVQQANAEEVIPNFTLGDCINMPDKPCIESFKATDENGTVHKFTLTGRAFIGNDTSGPNGSYPNAREDEYEAKTLKLPNGESTKIIVRAFVFAYGNNPCEWSGNYCETTEFMQIVIERTWLDPRSDGDFLSLTHRKNSLICGTIQTPERCQSNLRFGQNLVFDLDLRLPQNFDFSFVNGRSSTFNIKNNPPNAETNQLKLRRVTIQMGTVVSSGMIFNQLSTNPYGESDYADFEEDRPLLNLFTYRSTVATSLGDCAKVPSMSVITNGNNASVPIWNPVTQSIDVNIQGPHFKVDGSLNTGFFQARISKEIGKCLWGIDLSSKTVATISISEQGSGISHIETAASKYASDNYYFTLSNFHFSNPTISLTFNNAKDIPSFKAPSKKVTIQCTNGKKTLTRVAVNPSCPKGYKKVR